MGNLIKVLPLTSFDYSSLANNDFTEVVHGEFNVLHGKELVVIPRVSARVSGSGTITVIVRVFFPADDDAGDPVGPDIITQVISSGSPPNGFVARVSGGLPLWVRVLTKFTQPITAGALLCRHEIDLMINES